MDIIIIDPGHGGEDPGAVNSDLGLCEKDINLAVATKLLSLLLNPSARTLVKLTRPRDIFASLPARTDYANRLQECFPESRSIFVSLHCNAFSDTHVRGMEIFHFPESKSGEKLAASVLEAIAQGLSYLPSRGLKTSADLAVLKNTRIPAILIEMEFLTNPEAGLLLADDNFQWAMAQSIACGIRSYLESESS